MLTSAMNGCARRCLARRPGMREGDLAAFSASTSGTTTPVDDGSADIGVLSAETQALTWVRSLRTDAWLGTGRLAFGCRKICHARSGLY